MKSGGDLKMSFTYCAEKMKRWRRIKNGEKEVGGEMWKGEQKASRKDRKLGLDDEMDVEKVMKRWFVLVEMKNNESWAGNSMIVYRITTWNKKGKSPRRSGGE
jgi:hypothetical protein